MDGNNNVGLHKKNKNVARNVSLTGIFDSPLPPPEVLAKYEQIYAGLANRVMLLAENESEYRHKTNQYWLENSYKQQAMGQIFGFIIALVAIIAGSYVALNGYQIAGSIIGGSGLVSLVSVFVLGRKKGNA